MPNKHDDGQQCVDMIPDNSDLHFIDFRIQSLSYIMNCLSNRQRWQRESWLIYIGQAALEKNVIKALELKSVPLDLDDDVLLITKLDAGKANMHLEIGEIYKISKDDLSLEYQNIGIWSKGGGLKLTKVQKWYRRSDLKVLCIVLPRCLLAFNAFYHSVQCLLAFNAF